MSTRTLNITDSLYDYILKVSLREPEALRRLREETGKLPNANWQIAPEQGQFMALLVELVGARRTLDIGTFTGYSALAVALALPDDGQVIACDIMEEWTAMGRKFWREAGVAHKVDLRLGPALETLDGLIAEGQAGSFDFAFIDADKQGYLDYFERALTLLRAGGLICVDNVLWNGRVLDPEHEGADTRGIHAFNEKLRDDQRVTLSLVPIADGVTLARKRG